MFDVGFWEMAFISVIALVVIGPERLPGAARTAGMWVGKARRMISDVKSDIKREMDQHDSLSSVTDIKNELASATKEVSEATKDSDPLGVKQAGESIKSSVNDVSSTLKEAEKAASENTGKSVIKKKVTKKKTSKKKTPKKKTPKKKVAKKKTATKKVSKKRAKKKKTMESKVIENSSEGTSE